MKLIRKESTYLESFSKESKLQYEFVGNVKWIGWFIIFLMAYAPVILSSILSAIPMLLMLLWQRDMTLMESEEFLTLSQLISTGIVIIIVLIYVKFVERRAIGTIGLSGKSKVKRYFKGAFIAILMHLTFVIVISLLGYGHLTLSTISSDHLNLNPIIIYTFMFLGMFLIQGASEEVLVRGWVLPALARHYNVVLSIILSSMLFCIMHVFNPNLGVVPVLNLFLYGVFASLYAMNDGGLWGIFANHSIWNWFMGVVLGLPVSGIRFTQYSIFQFKVGGPTILTGGEFGPEGSIIISGILLVGIAILLKKISVKQADKF